MILRAVTMAGAARSARKYRAGCVNCEKFQICLHMSLWHGRMGINRLRRHADKHTTCLSSVSPSFISFRHTPPRVQITLRYSSWSEWTSALRSTTYRHKKLVLSERERRRKSGSLHGPRSKYGLSYSMMALITSVLWSMSAPDWRARQSARGVAAGRHTSCIKADARGGSQPTMAASICIISVLAYSCSRDYP